MTTPFLTSATGLMDREDWFDAQYADPLDAGADVPLKLRWPAPNTVEIEHLKAAKESLDEMRKAHRI